jgi:hypothetical protein
LICADLGISETTSSIFALGYGEFFTARDAMSKASPLRLPTDVLSKAMPVELKSLSTGADDVFRCGESDS